MKLSHLQQGQFNKQMARTHQHLQTRSLCLLPTLFFTHKDTTPTTTTIWFFSPILIRSLGQVNEESFKGEKLKVWCFK